MGITPLTFSGISQYSDDFQVIVDRTVAIASLPVQALQNEQTDILEKKQSWTGISAVTGGLAASLRNIGALASSGALAASSSNSAKVTASVAEPAVPGSYLITEINSLARVASATSLAGYADTHSAEVAGAGDYLQLVVGADQYDINLSAATDNLEAIRDHINNLNAGVSATIIDTGDGGGQRYFLALTAFDPGQKSIQLRTEADNPASDILATTDPGSDAVFKVNGKSITKTSNTVTDVIPGVALKLAATTTPGETITLTIASNRAPLTSALADFAEAYNSLAAELDAQFGETAGLLSGDFLVRDLQTRMRSLTAFEGTGVIGSLAQLGLTLNNDGTMSFDSSVFESLSTAEMDSAIEFLGSASSGLAAFESQFTEFSDPIDGLIVAQQADYDKRDQSLSDQIEVLSERIAQMQSTLLTQLQHADALLASLESQQNILYGSIESLNLVTYGKNEE